MIATPTTLWVLRSLRVDSHDFRRSPWVGRCRIPVVFFGYRFSCQYWTASILGDFIPGQSLVLFEHCSQTESPLKGLGRYTNWASLSSSSSSSFPTDRSAGLGNWVAVERERKLLSQYPTS